MQLGLLVVRSVFLFAIAERGKRSPRAGDGGLGDETCEMLIHRSDGDCTGRVPMLPVMVSGTRRNCDGGGLTVLVPGELGAWLGRSCCCSVCVSGQLMLLHLLLFYSMVRRSRQSLQFLIRASDQLTAANFVGL